MQRMGGSSHEIEIKLRYVSAEAAREALTGVGAQISSERRFEDNILYDRTVDPLKDKERLLRLRRKGERAWLTFKAPVEGEFRHKVRREHETPLADPDAMEQILLGLDYRPVYRYQKYRAEYELEGLVICLDETPVGCFVELEGSPETIDLVANRLGFDPSQYICDTYRDLHVQAATAEGRPVGDLIFPGGVEARE